MEAVRQKLVDRREADSRTRAPGSNHGSNPGSDPGGPAREMRCGLLPNPVYNSGMDDGHEPATKADVKALDLRIDMLRSEMQHSHDDLVERISDSETRVLNAFYT